tara:strand:- start:25362 stop:25841 length:480 start_codon:yes stop_codon:yes gene_type:complete
MGMSSQGSGKGAKSALNVTPLVDVVLVLLVIFMVTMPVMMRNITVEVPEDAPEFPIPTDPPLVIRGMLDGTVEILDGSNASEIVQRTQLATALRATLQAASSPSKTIFVDFEDGMPWAQIVSVMDTVKGVGKTGPVASRSELTVAITKHPAPSSILHNN